jgi:hypothetical protein
MFLTYIQRGRTNFSQPISDLILMGSLPAQDTSSDVLLTANDTITGTRHAKWLTGIKVRKVE